MRHKVSEENRRDVLGLSKESRDLCGLQLTIECILLYFVSTVWWRNPPCPLCETMTLTFSPWISKVAWIAGASSP